MQDNTYPVVSVIVPNYNHAPYLEKRINSVLQQTYENFELIILDDCSSDNSRDIINQYAIRDARIRTCFNEDNSGSTFKQWNKGVRLARGEYVWIAESDDYADKHYLERMLPVLLDHTHIGMIYCMSYKVNEYDEIIGDAIPRDNENINPDRWKKNFMNKGAHECAEVLLFKNVISNASGLLFRKEVFIKCGGAAENLKLCGDWLTYTKMLKLTDVAFTADYLNYFRVHSNTVRKKKSFNSLEAIWERFQVLQYVVATFEVSKENHVKALIKLVTDFFRQKQNMSLLAQQKEKKQAFAKHIRTYHMRTTLGIALMRWSIKKVKKRILIF